MATTIPQDVREIIRAKKHLYCRSVDTKDWDLFDKVALPDARMTYKHHDGRPVTTGIHDRGTSAVYDFKSRAEFKAFTEKTSRLQLVHIVDSGYFEPGDEPDEVKAVFLCIAVGGPLASVSEGHGNCGGHYHEVYKKVGDDWFLKSCDFVMLYHKTA